MHAILLEMRAMKQSILIVIHLFCIDGTVVNQQTGWASGISSGVTPGSRFTSVEGSSSFDDAVATSIIFDKS